MAIAKGLLDPQTMPTVQQLSDLIFAPGFSTADSVTELAGRGVGMDVVRSDIVALGGRIQLLTTPNEGTRFTLRIPLTLAMSQVLMVVAQDIQYAIPSSLIHTVVSVKPSDLAQAYSQKKITQHGVVYPFAHLSDLLNIPVHSALQNRSASVALISNGSEQLAVHVDMVVGNQEAIVKPLNSLMSRIPGLSSATLLNNGNLCLILDPLQLWTVFSRRSAPHQATSEAVDGRVKTTSSSSAYALNVQAPARSSEPLPMAQVLNERGAEVRQTRGEQNPAESSNNIVASTRCVMVVDDSITVRKVTQKLLLREGWDVLLAKDGIDALEQLQTVTPNVMLVDIEMPRMDGFDLARNVRADDRLKTIPIIMITSRIADKHRDHALSLGVNAYMGKPYRDDELLAEMRKLTST
jgi:chemosensory pili system protein ChpA (sensor histidine kinase/response regulator)